MHLDPEQRSECPVQDPSFREVIETLRAWPDASAPDLTHAVLARIRARRRASLAFAAALTAVLSAALLMTTREKHAADVSFVSASDVFSADADKEPMNPNGEAAARAFESVPDEDQSLERARAWLISRQDVDGGWTMGRSGAAANYTVGTTALALLALLRAEPDEATRESLARGASFLASQQDGDGLLGPAITGSLYNHALACLALIRVRDVGVAHPYVDGALGKGLALIARSQRPEGGWTYLRSRGAPNSSLSVWALRVLMEARERGVADYTAEIERGLAWLERTVDADGRAGYRRAGDHPHGSETLTAAVALCLLEWRDRPHPQLTRMLENIRRDISDTQAPMDLYRIFFQTAALRADPHTHAELRALAARLRAIQDTHGDDAGSWPPLDRWSAAGGRVYSTALALLALAPDRAPRS